MSGPYTANRCRRKLAALSAVTLLIAGCGSGGQETSARSGQPAATATAPAAGLEQQFVAVVKETQPEVAQIQTNSGLGSGVVMDDKGDIVTNAHVVADATSLTVTLADGRRFPARILGVYAPDDLALVTIGSGHLVKLARFADSSKLAVGEIVLAAGSPLGLQSSVTDGIISALGRNVSEGQGVMLPDVIQTSAPINPGNSGGALIDLKGRVIGIPTLAAANPQQGSAAAGIGFAIPSNTVTDIAGQIIRYGRVVDSHRAALGASFSSSAASPGAVVIAVQAGGPAERAGITVGDVIVKAAGHDTPDASTLAGVLADHRPGERIALSVVGQSGISRTLTVELGQL